MSYEWIEAGLKKRKKSQRWLAQTTGIEADKLNKSIRGKRRLQAEEIEKIKQILELGSEKTEDSSTIEPRPPRERDARDLPNTREMPLDITVLGSGAAGPDGQFELNGQVVDMVRRPPRLRGVREAYGLYVSGTSMSPWREDGALVYVHPGLPVKIGDYVVVQLHAPEEDLTPAHIKRLIKRTGTEIRLLQYNPRKEIVLNLKRVKTIHRIVDWSELLGI